MYKISLKTAQKGNEINQNGLKINEKELEVKFLDQKYLSFSDFFSRILGYHPSPLNRILRHNQGLQAHDVQEEPHLNKRFRQIVLPTGEKSTLLPHNTSKLMQ